MSRRGWEPRTRLGKQVAEEEITTMDEALNSGLPLKEPEITDQLLPGLEDDVLDINMVQRMTDSGRRVKFRCVVAIGNRDARRGRHARLRLPLVFPLLSLGGLRDRL